MLNNEYPPLGGGTGTVNKEILDRLIQYPEIKIDLITGSLENGNIIQQLSLNVRIISLGLKSKNIHHASNTELITYTIKAFFYALKMQKKEKYDFSFAWSTIPAGFVSYLLKVFYKLPFIVRVGGPDIPGFEERYKIIYKFISPVIKLIWKRAKLIITKCQVEHDMILTIIGNLPLKIIYNGVDTGKFRSKEVQKNKTLRIICPARLIQRKGQDILIKAVSRLKQKNIIMQVDLVGDGDEKENYLTLAEKLGVADLINFKSYVPREQMEKAYHSADIFVLPSYNEGMSNALLEAMACGLPVVVTDVGGTSELLEEGGNGYIFPTGNVENLSLILEKIAQAPNQLKKLGKKSRKKAEDLSWNNIVNFYVDLFESIAKKDI